MSTLHPLAYLREAERLVKQARLEAADGNYRTASRLQRRALELEGRTYGNMPVLMLSHWVNAH